MGSIEEDILKNAALKNDILNQIIEQASITPVIWSGCNFLADVLNHEGIVPDQWMSFMDLEFKVDGKYSPNSPFVHLTLLSRIEKVFSNGKKDSNIFFEFKSYVGVDRRIFKSMHGEYQKFKAAIEKELAGNGNSNWPYFVFPMKAYNFITSVDEYEIDEVGEGEYMITARQRDVIGYYTVYINLRGSLDESLLNAFEGA
jgi:hypothetical protein